MVSEMEGDLDDPGSNPPSAMKPPGDSGPDSALPSSQDSCENKKRKS